MLQKIRKLISRHYGLFLLIPAVTVVIVLVLYPSSLVTRMSFYDWSFGYPWESAEFVGLQNWLNILENDPFLLNSIERTFLYVGGRVILSVLIGLGVALLLREVSERVATVFQALFLIPFVILPAAVGLMWKTYTSEYGFFQYLTTLIGIGKISWTNQFPLLSMTLAMSWIGIPFMIVIFYASLVGIPPQLYESAKLDGASKWLTFKEITLPQMKTVLFIAVLLITGRTFMRFDLPWTLYHGGPGHTTDVLSVHISRIGFVQGNLGVASIVSIILIAIMLTIGFIMIYRMTK